MFSDEVSSRYFHRAEQIVRNQAKEQDWISSNALAWEDWYQNYLKGLDLGPHEKSHLVGSLRNTKIPLTRMIDAAAKLTAEKGTEFGAQELIKDLALFIRDTESQFVSTIGQHIAKILDAIHSYQNWRNNTEQSAAVTYVNDLETQLVRLADPGEEGIIGQLGMVHAVSRSIETSQTLSNQSKEFLKSRISATFSEDAFKNLLGVVVGIGIGLFVANK